MMNRKQIQRLLGLGTRWTNQLLEPLVSDGLIAFREGLEGRIYKLSKKGCGIYGSKYVWGWGNLNHTLLRNWFIVNHGGWSDDVKVEVDLQVEGESFGICDATIQKDELIIVEVDRFQKWRANKDKLKRYRDLKNEGISFTLVWVVEMESRIPKIKEVCKELGLACEVYNSQRLG